MTNRKMTLLLAQKFSRPRLISKTLNIKIFREVILPIDL
jgi:hypothetical protein